MALDGGGQGNEPNIFVRLRINVGEFVENVRSAMASAAKAVTDELKGINKASEDAFESINVDGMTKDMDKVAARLNDIRKQILSMKNLGKVDASGSILPGAGLADVNSSKLGVEMVTAAQKAGVSVKALAVEWVKMGKISVQTAADMVMGLTQEMLKVQDLTGSVEELRDEYTKVAEIAAPGAEEHAEIMEQNAQQLKDYTQTIKEYGLNSNQAARMTAELYKDEERRKEIIGQLNRVTAELGVSYQKAAQISISTGKLTVAEAQAGLYAAKQNALSQRQLETALNGAKDGFKKTNVEAEKYINTQERLNRVTQGLTNGNKQSSFISTIQKSFGVFNSIVGAIALVSFSLKRLYDTLEEGSQRWQEYERSVVLARSAMAGIVEGGTLDEVQGSIEKIIEDSFEGPRLISQKGAQEAIGALAPALRNADLGAEELTKSMGVVQQMVLLTGKDAKDVANDVMQYWGGSTRTLDKYGLNIREADLRLQAMKLGIDKSLDSMSQQEQLLLRNSLLIEKIGILSQNTGDILETEFGKQTALQAYTADATLAFDKMAAAADTTIKSITVVFLEFFDVIVNRGPDLLDFVDRLTGKALGLGSLATIMNSVGNTLDGFNEWVARSAANDTKYMETIKETKAMYAEFSKDGKFSGYQNMGFVESGSNILTQSLAAARKANDDQLIDLFQTVKKFQGVVIITPQQIDGMVKLGVVTKEAGDKLKASLSGIYAEMEKLEGVTDATTGAMVDDFANAKEASEKFGADIIKIHKDRQKDLDDAKEGFDKDNEKLTKDLQAEDAALTKKHNDEIAKLIADSNKKRLEAERDLGRDLRDLDIDTERDREDAIRNAEDKRTKLAEEGNKKRKDLVADYLFNLQKAIASNDAIAIRDLEFQFKRDQANQDEEDNKAKSSIEDDLAKELADIELKAQRKKEDLQRAYEDELADIAQYEAEKRQELNKAYAEERAAFAQASIQKRLDLIAAYDEERAAINEKYDEKLADVAAKLAEEYDLTQTELDALLDQYDTYLDGKSALFAAEYQEYEQHLTDMRELTNSIGGGRTAGGRSRGGRSRTGEDVLPDISDTDENDDRHVNETTRNTDTSSLNIERSASAPQNVNVRVDATVHGLSNAAQEEVLKIVTDVFTEAAKGIRAE